MKILKEGEEISWENLSNQKQKAFKDILKVFNMKFDTKNIRTVWYSIHGLSITYDPQEFQYQKSSPMIDKDLILKASKIKDFRWYQYAYDRHDFGLTLDY